MGSRIKNEKIEELRNKGIPVYSYSKLNSWHECKFNWYNTYILHKKSNDNIYSAIGTVIHDGIEAVYHKEIDMKEVKKQFNETVLKNEKKGIKFPENPETTKINYLKNMNHFFENYKVLDTEMKTEQFVLLKIPRIENAINDKDFIWVQMYIDSIIPVYDGGEFKSVILNDWKTSSKFNKEKLLKGSRQLLIYKMGVEQVTGVAVSKIQWTMLKYVYCCYRTKGSKKVPSTIKKSMQERKSCVKYFQKKVINDLINSGMDTLDAEFLIGKAINQNDLTLLPEFIQEKYWIEDCYLECDFNDESMEACKQWIIKTVDEIESIGDSKYNYKPVEINEKTNYFCFNLCGRPDCIHLLKYKTENSNNFSKANKQKQINKELNTSKKLINLDSLFK